MATFQNSITPIGADASEVSNPVSSSGYTFHLPYWVVVIAIALMAWRSLAEFGLSARCLKPGWQQHLVQVCSDSHAICKSVKFVDSDAWWSNRVQVVVTPQQFEGGKGAGETSRGNRDKSQNAFELVNSALTSDQHQFVEVVLRGSEVVQKVAMKANATGEFKVATRAAINSNGALAGGRT